MWRSKPKKIKNEPEEFIYTLKETDRDNADIRKLSPKENFLQTGHMGGCATLIAMSNPSPQNGRYENVIGQHGRGGLLNVDFKRIVSEGGIANSPDTKILVITAADCYSLWRAVLDLREMLENECNLSEAIIEFYNCPNAIVDRKGNVIDAFRPLQIKKMYWSIAKFLPYIIGFENNYTKPYDENVFWVDQEFMESKHVIK